MAKYDKFGMPIFTSSTEISVWLDEMNAMDQARRKGDWGPPPIVLKDEVRRILKRHNLIK